MNLQLHIDSGALEFIDVLAEVQQIDANLTSVLHEMLRRVQTYIEIAQDASPLVILDDISMLEWIGLPMLEIQRFVRALRAVSLKVWFLSSLPSLCIELLRQANATLVIRHHIVTTNEPDVLLRHVLQVSTYPLQVRPLATGKSGAVSGEVCPCFLE